MFDFLPFRNSELLEKNKKNESSFSKAPGAAQAWAKFSNKGEATSMKDLSSLKKDGKMLIWKANICIFFENMSILFYIWS